MHKTLLGLLFIVFAFGANAQNTFNISGVVRDQKETLPGASIYVSGYKIATLTDADGKFTLPNLKPGNYDILVQMIGYLPFSKNVIISDQAVKVDFILKDSPITLAEVVIRVDPNRAKYINQFKEYFIGRSPNAKYCKILNPQVLRVDFDVTNSLLTVKTDEFLIVENKALGYRIKYMLDYFEYNSRTHIIYYSGKPFFEELKASTAVKKKYIANRETAYYGSAQHFFKSLYQNNTQNEGFLITKVVKIPNPNRLPDSIIIKNIAKLRTPPEKTGIRKNVMIKDTSQLAFWVKQQQMPKFIEQFNREKTQTDTLVHYFNKNLKLINYTNSLCIMYTKERETLAYDETGFSIFRPLDIPNYQISLARLTDGPLRFYENGGIFDSRALLFEGFWAYEKVADMVPMDYIPLKNKL